MVLEYFLRDFSTGSISCSERKKRIKTILKQDSKSRKEYQNTNQPGSSSNRCCCCRSVVAPLSHRYRTSIAPLLSLLLLLHSRSAVTLLSLRYRSAVSTLILPLEATTVSDIRSDSSSDSVATAGAKAGATAGATEGAAEAVEEQQGRDS